VGLRLFLKTRFAKEGTVVVKNCLEKGKEVISAVTKNGGDASEAAKRAMKPIITPFVQTSALMYRLSRATMKLPLLRKGTEGYRKFSTNLKNARQHQYSNPSLSNHFANLAEQLYKRSEAGKRWFIQKFKPKSDSIWGKIADDFKAFVADCADGKSIPESLWNQFSSRVATELSELATKRIAGFLKKSSQRIRTKLAQLAKKSGGRRVAHWLARPEQQRIKEYFQYHFKLISKGLNKPGQLKHIKFSKIYLEMTQFALGMLRDFIQQVVLSGITGEHPGPLPSLSDLAQSQLKERIIDMFKGKGQDALAEGFKKVLK
jgi:hypothetical protein